ncbi:hypothetical protein A2572_01795 [Candidatus Collierbacteria bacterium RIFOXYD1_FULL_40_9]|uniref:Uncharacterized protein n=1 Tax=Candidatus Collierbacteria bacterium RIFOXYD1_FULL_40_9 TaxID=1817731 RepID=A0A1F5FV01_9BACT|nr:MAG: hypothetical protein A2572_01795 [Candidatus Collierbacteria bacterium RIFOXYD1_FULL_40_9]
MDKNDVQTLIHLIKSQSEQTRKELRSEVVGIKSELEFKIALLERKLDDKFENHRRSLVNDFQNFQDAILSELVELRQEITINSGHRKLFTEFDHRLSKIEKRLLAN